jgi:hypothetical protein
VAEASRRGAAAVAAHAAAWEPTTVEAVGGGARLVVRCQAQWVGAMSVAGAATRAAATRVVASGGGRQEAYVGSGNFMLIARTKSSTIPNDA